MIIDAYVESIESGGVPGQAETARVRASYESANIFGSLEFEVPIQEARQYYVGQKLMIVISTPKVGITPIGDHDAGVHVE